MAEHDTADQEHLREITQAQLIAEAPKDHEGNYVAWVLRSVQLAGAALVELSAALPATKPTVSLCCPFRPLRHGRRPATHASHTLAPLPRSETLASVSNAGQKTPTLAQALTEPEIPPRPRA